MAETRANPGLTPLMSAKKSGRKATHPTMKKKLARAKRTRATTIGKGKKR
jgi:hypothetical protein